MKMGIIIIVIGNVIHFIAEDLDIYAYMLKLIKY